MLKTRTKLNNCSISEEQEKFSDINPLGGANHPSLIYFNFLTVVSRISVNFLYKSLVKRWHSGIFTIPEFLPLNDSYGYLIVSVVKVLCIQAFGL